MSLIAIGISAFVATNIDDIFVLMMFFSSSCSSSMTFPTRQIVLGQYIGIFAYRYKCTWFAYLTNSSAIYHRVTRHSADSNRH